MKRRFSNIALSVLLLCGFLFTQVTANFFHHHEEEHVSGIIHVVKKDADNTFANHYNVTFEKTKPKCSICSLHLLHELACTDITSFTFGSKWERTPVSYLLPDFFVSAVHRIGRAPPAIF